MKYVQNRLGAMCDEEGCFLQFVEPMLQCNSSPKRKREKYYKTIQFFVFSLMTLIWSGNGNVNNMILKMGISAEGNRSFFLYLSFLCFCFLCFNLYKIYMLNIFLVTGRPFLKTTKHVAIVQKRRRKSNIKKMEERGREKRIKWGGSWYFHESRWQRI